MKRIIDFYLLEWKTNNSRKPLLLRGARQVGKTHAARILGQIFENFIEINLEFNESAKLIFENSVDPQKIVLQLSELIQNPIIPGKTLLFIDEIQQVPKAIISLRYFYELMPELHVIAAGSLLDFAIKEVGMPVGRVTSLYMYPLSFIEFLIALGHNQWVRTILEFNLNEETINNLNPALHTQLISTLANYIAIGGMPSAINEWIKTKNPEKIISREVKAVHSDILLAYQQDFYKYAKNFQIKYLKLLLENAINQLSNKFMFSKIGEYKKRELSPALELLEYAGLFYKVTLSAGQGIPLGAQANIESFKIIFLDIGLAQSLLKLDIAQWFIDPLNQLINKGEIIESFVGQELLAYSDPINKESLFYWAKDSREGNAEIDYLIQLKYCVVPIEVKSSNSKRIVSIHIFLDSHPKSLYAIRFWTGNYDFNSRIHSYPLYAIIKPIMESNNYLKNAILKMLS